MKKLLFIQAILIFSMSMALSSQMIVFSHCNFFDANSGKYLYDKNILLSDKEYRIIDKIPNNAIVINLGGRYIFPGFFSSYIDATKYPYLDLWSSCGISAAFSYSSFYYQLSRIASKDPATLINKNLFTINYETNACNLITSSLVFDKDNLSKQEIQYSIYLQNPKIIVVKDKAMKYLKIITEFAHTRNITIISLINTAKDFKESTQNGVKIIIGIPIDKINFKFSDKVYVVSNLNTIKSKYGRNSLQYKNALLNLRLIHKNKNKILVGKFSKIGMPYEEIKILSKFLTPKEIILGLTKYPYDAFKYNNKKDLLVFNEDPLRNIENIESLFLVIKNLNIANIIRASVNYSKNGSLNLLKNIDNTKLYGLMSLYPNVSFTKGIFGIGGSLCFPMISSNMYFDLFLSKNYHIGYDSGLSYKDFFYDYTYIFNEYEKQSLSYNKDGYKINYFGEYVLKNPFLYPQYDSGLFENLSLQFKNIKILIGADRISKNSYYKLEYKIHNKSEKENVNLYIGFSNSPYYQYKINMANCIFFDDYEKTSSFLFSLRISKDMLNLDKILTLPVGGEIDLYDGGTTLALYTSVKFNDSLFLITTNFKKFKFKAIFNLYDFK